MTQLLWPSTLLFWYCKLPSVRMIYNIRDTTVFNLPPVRGWEIQVRSADGTRRSESETHWSQRTERRTQAVLSWNKPVKSSSLQNLHIFYSSADFEKIKLHIFLVSHTLSCPTHTLTCVFCVCDMCTYELLPLPLPDCTSDPLSYNYPDI